MHMFQSLKRFLSFSTVKLPDVIGHRGASGWLPGHTIPCMDECVRAGADWVEFDVMPSRDGVLGIYILSCAHSPLNSHYNQCDL